MPSRIDHWICKQINLKEAVMKRSTTSQDLKTVSRQYYHLYWQYNTLCDDGGIFCFQFGGGEGRKPQDDTANPKKEAFLQATVEWAKKKYEYKVADQKLTECLLDLNKSPKKNAWIQQSLIHARAVSANNRSKMFESNSCSCRKCLQSNKWSKDHRFNMTKVKSHIFQ